MTGWILFYKYFKFIRENRKKQRVFGQSFKTKENKFQKGGPISLVFCDFCLPSLLFSFALLNDPNSSLRISKWFYMPNN